MVFKVTGRVYEAASHVGVPNVVVQAADNDLISDDELGEAITDHDGHFSIAYDEKDFKGLLENNPDLYIVVKSPDRMVTLYSSKKKVRKEASQAEHFEIPLSQEALEDLKPPNFKSFNTQATGYDPYNAFLLGLISAKSYRQAKKQTNDQWREQIKQEAKVVGFDPNHVYCFNNKGSQAILLADAEKIIVGFRGTEEKSDWDVNIDRLKDSKFRKQLGVSIHGGFLKYVYEVWHPYQDPQNRPEAKGIKAIIEEESKGQKKSLWFTGHSLGGAAAVVAAATYVLDKMPTEVRGIYTFGQPRAGDRKFVAWYNERLKDRTFRFVNNNDAVTRVPSWAPAFFFAHGGQLKYITDRGEIIDLEDTNMWERIKDMFSGILKDIGEQGLDSISDHSMSDGYLPALRRALARQT